MQTNGATSDITRTVSPLEFAMNRIFHEPVFRVWQESEPTSTGSLALDIHDEESAIVVTASLPGFKKDDIEIGVEKGVLTISATHTEETTEGDGKRYYRRERRMGSMTRRIRLPEGVDDTGASATLTDGVLTLRLPKSQAAQPKRIAIN